MTFDPAAVAWPEVPAMAGLVPAIVQDRSDGRVLMLAWVDRAALAATLASGDVHFHSRSRDRLWHKGETSGNVLRLASIALDCDGDALLLTVDPAGPTCHLFCPRRELVAVGKVNVGPAPINQLPARLAEGDSIETTITSPKPVTRWIFPL